MNRETDPLDPTPPSSPSDQAEPAAPSDPVEPAALPDAPEPGETAAAPESTAVFVRRSRTPALGFWIVLCVAVPAIGALLAAPFLGLPDLPSFLNLALLAVMFVGVPLAAIASLVDAIRHRGPRTPRS